MFPIVTEETAPFSVFEIDEGAYDPSAYTKTIPEDE